MRPTDTLHTLPTHLGVRDPVLWMLDDIQLVKVATGVLVAAFILRQTVLPVGARAGLSAVALLGAAACALVRIDGRSLEEWLLLAGRYWSRPRSLVWGSRQPDHPWTRTAFTTEPGRTGGGCVIRHLRVTWLDPEDSTESDDDPAGLEPTADELQEAVA
jgi:hypothetical protein